MTQPNALMTSDLAYLANNQPLAPLAVAALRVAVTLDKWSTRHRTRKALARLEPHHLKDIGLNPRAAQDEARRMFWHG